MAAVIKMGSPVGFKVCSGDRVGEDLLGEDVGGVGSLICKGAAVGGPDKEGVEHTKGSVLMDGGGKAC